MVGSVPGSGSAEDRLQWVQEGVEGEEVELCRLLFQDLWLHSEEEREGDS